MNDDQWWERGDKAYVEVEIDCDRPDSEGDAYVVLPGAWGGLYIHAEYLKPLSPSIDPRTFENPHNIEKFLEA